MKILVTGVSGFIGSYFAKYMLGDKLGIKGPVVGKYTGSTGGYGASGVQYKVDIREAAENYEIIGVARNSDQRKFRRLESIKDNPNFRLIFKDLVRDDISGLLEFIDVVVHFAASTFVDHSIKDPSSFIQSNIVGTYKLLEEARKYKPKLFIQISTDEVYGAILKGSYREDARLNPSNPYSATKAAGDALVTAYHNTYGLDTIITRTENVYGPYQHPQKALPTFCRYALENKPLPVYGDGRHSRQWLHVEDKCSALRLLIEKGRVGEIYHIAGAQELMNLDLAKKVLRILNKPEDQIKFIDDRNIRPGHDRRYALSNEKIYSLGWRPKWSLDKGLENVVKWYVENPNWTYG